MFSSRSGGWKILVTRQQPIGSKVPLGARVLREEAMLAPLALDDVFGFELLQVGAWGPARHLLDSARTQHTTLVASELGSGATLCAPLDSLPFRSESIDAIFLPHTLELVEDPYAVLREAERVLCAEGCLMICGFNPFSGWGVRRAFARHLKRPPFPPQTQRMLSERRLRDWVALLGLDVDSVYGYLGRAADQRPGARAARARAPLDGRRLPAQGAQARQDPHAGAAAAPCSAARAGRRGGAYVESRFMTQVEIYTDGALPWKSRTRRLGGSLGGRYGAQGDLRRRIGDHQQPHGTDGRHRGLGRAEAPMLGQTVHRFEVRASGHHRVAAELEGARLAYGGTCARQEQDLWELLDAAASEQNIEWHWVKGHSGHEGNEYVDQLANVAIDRMLAAR